MENMRTCIIITFLLSAISIDQASAQWITRNERFHMRGPWNWSLQRELKDLYIEFNGIDFGHAHLAETLLNTQEPDAIEKARVEVLDFIFSESSVPPDEDQISPEFTRMAWEVRSAFNWAHTLHRSLYDLFASDDVADKEGAYQRILADYFEKSEAITSHHLDLHGKLWSFPESKAFRDKFPKFNTQIWAYHWLQAAAYDVQLMGDSSDQRELMPKIIEHYHGYLREPPVQWQMMPMFMEAAPQFAKRFPKAATIFDNLHMLHDNMDDILCRPDLYPTKQAQREAMLRILDIYLHRNHEPVVKYPEFHAPHTAAGGEEHGEHEGMGEHRPPSAHDVLAGRHAPAAPPESPTSRPQPTDQPQHQHNHSGHEDH